MKAKLKEILDLHKIWVDRFNSTYRCSSSEEGKRASLSFSKLVDEDLSYAELSRARFVSSILCCTDLSFANLTNANLEAANLYHANLECANLKNADLNRANLVGADLREADLTGVDLVGANLADTRLYGAKGSLIEYRKGKILTEDIIGYKKCRCGVIVTLCIPRGAIVFSINGHKCRTNKAKVVAIDGGTRAISVHKYMSYYVGDEFTIYNFNCEYNIECGEGIHFFMNRKDAELY